MSEVTFSNEFLSRRKKDFDSINTKANTTNGKFRGKSYKELISGLMGKALSIVSITDALKAKKTGILNIKSKAKKRSIGALYLREYNDSIKDAEANNFDIELLIEKETLNEGRFLINAISDIFGEHDLVVTPENMPGMGILIWTSGSGFYDDLTSRLKKEYGENTIIKENNQSLKSFDKPKVKKK